MADHTCQCRRVADGVEVTTPAGLLLARLQAGPSGRPYLHPVRTPGGVVVTENAPAHHPWQHGLYFGLNDVNGVGFWTEGLLAGRPRDGTIVVTAFDATAAGWHVAADWRSPEGDVLLRDTQRWTAAVGGDALYLDLHWTLTAAVDVTLGQYAYGGLFLRMPFRPECGAAILAGNGATTLDGIEGQRAAWVGVRMTIEGALASVAVCDHPSNPDHPTPWRADSEYGIGPAIQRTAPLRLSRGESMLFRYRVVIADGGLSAERIAAACDTFSESLA